MGCFHSSLNRINTAYIFSPNDIFHLTESWNIIKAHNLQKFAQDVLLRTINQSSLIRQFWISKIQVDANNYDYSQSESCLRTDLSWHIELHDYSIQFITIFDKLLSVINDENRFQTQIRSLDISENIFLIEYESLLIVKNCMMKILRERFEIFNYDFTDEYEKVWEKFLTFIIEYMIKQRNEIRAPTDIIMVSATNNDQSSHNVVN